MNIMFGFVLSLKASREMKIRTDRADFVRTIGLLIDVHSNLESFIGLAKNSLSFDGNMSPYADAGSALEAMMRDVEEDFQALPG